MEGHIISALIEKESVENKYLIKKISNKNLALLISGGHTEIIYFEKFGNYKKIGQTVDDAIGEAFDKVARHLGLPYPGGPEISNLAEQARKKNIEIEKINQLPRPMLHSNDFNFSFSGLKTAVIYKLKALANIKNEIEKEKTKDENIKMIISLDFENSVTEILLKKINKAIKQYNPISLIIGGGVIANQHIREEFIKFCTKENINLSLPEKNLTGDNALMIGSVAILKIINQNLSAELEKMTAIGNFSIEEI